ncbi:MAG: MYXO-CTERM sorting domain-containing protein [Myxococcota bacterium]|nr:MYXO-CTERM sorting domain-containing protein [Myxococcota bacterium]
MKRLGSLTRPLFAVMLIFMIFACSGGGCSGCAGCGILPIPGGFPIAERIPNSAQVRLSESGITFIEENIDDIIAILLEDGLNFPIPRTEGSEFSVDYTICPDSDCVAHGEVESFTLDPVVPNRLNLHIRVVLDSRDTAGARRPIPARLDPPIFPASTCQIDLNTREGTRAYVGLVANIDFVAETRPARAGYTKIVLSNAALAEGEGIEDADVDIDGCSAYAWLLNLFKRTIIRQLEGQVSSLIQSAADDALCQTRTDLGCPTGTHDRGDTAPDATCYYEPAGGSDECVPILLGMDGRGDLGAQFLGGFSPGAHAPGQFALASGGDGEAVNGGLSLFMVGGFMSMDRTFTESPGHNPCVPVIEPPPLPDIARAAAFRGNVIPGTSTPTHLGIGIAEDYLDYAGYGMFDSGMLCLGAGTRLSQQLSTGLVAGIAPSLRNLAFPQTAAPLTLAIRPQQPPDFTIGTDAAAPVLTITLPQLQIDWYVWSTERYVRFMTYETDLTIEIDLTVEGGEIVPRIESVVATNSTVTNSELLTEMPPALASAVESVLSTFAGMLGGSISPFALPDIMGFELDVPPDGIRGVADSGEAFLGLFANLRLATTPGMLIGTAETSLEISDLSLDPSSMTIDSWGQGERNSVWLNFGAEGPAGADYEYSYRIDGMTWSHWTSDRRVHVDSDVLLLQARHTVEARARVRGEATSVDPTPASAELIIDVLPPELQVSRDGTGAYVAHGADLISPESALQYRFRMGDGEWTEWQSSPRLELDSILLDGGELGVEVLDEAGNVGTATLPLIRGIPNPAGGGCDCAVASGNTDRNGPLALLASLAVLGAMILRRRRHVARSRSVRRAVTIALLALPILLGSVGCECSTPMGPACDDACLAAVPPATTMGSLCCPATDMCESYDVDALCMPGWTCPVADVVLDDTCDISCTECVRKPPLDPGQLATDLDLVVAEGGEIYVSGYSPGVPPSTRYGDLVFGEVGPGGTVTWDIVDGAPSSPITNDPDQWRGGVSAPGDDVGRWTSMADSGTALYIAYYDRTNSALRVAIGSPGAWNVQTVDDAGDAGRYPSIVLLEGGVPAIAYMRIEPAEGGTGRLRSSVRLATASSAMPGDATDWTITEVAGADMACRPEFCGTGEACLESGECIVPTSDCATDCSGDTQCSMGSCQPALAASHVEDLPPAYGLFANLVRTSAGLALVWYDRGQGNIWGAELPAIGGAWGAPFLIDGYMRGDPASGDSGIGASLFVDAAGTWHVAYVDGAEEALRYAAVAAGIVSTRETIDDGASDGTTAHTDGRHVVGDDASIVVTDGGEIRVVYQDSTSHRLMLARRPSGGGAWAVSILDGENHTGFWADQALVGGTSYVATWWREEARAGSMNGVRVLTVE